MSTVPIIDNFVTNIRAACDARGISQRELSRLSGVHYVHIHKIFAGKLNPTVDTCEKIATSLGMRPDISFLEPSKTPLDGITV